jgi:hypothetical protein
MTHFYPHFLPLRSPVFACQHLRLYLLVFRLTMEPAGDQMMLTFCSAILPCHRFAHHLPSWRGLPCPWYRRHLYSTSRSISCFTDPDLSIFHIISQVFFASSLTSMQAAFLTFCRFISYCYFEICPTCTTTRGSFRCFLTFRLIHPSSYHHLNFHHEISVSHFLGVI